MLVLLVLRARPGGWRRKMVVASHLPPRPLLRLGVPNDLSLVWLRAGRVFVLKTFPSNESFILEYSWFRC